MLSPSELRVRHRNQALMLRRSVAPQGKVAAVFADVLAWASAEGIIDDDQHAVLLRELAARSDHLTRASST